MPEAEDKIRDIVVIPEIDSCNNSNLSQALTECADNFIQKIEDSKKVCLNLLHLSLWLRMLEVCTVFVLGVFEFLISPKWQFLRML